MPQGMPRSVQTATDCEMRFLASSAVQPKAGCRHGHDGGDKVDRFADLVGNGRVPEVLLRPVNIKIDVDGEVDPAVQSLFQSLELRDAERPRRLSGLAGSSDLLRDRGPDDDVLNPTVNPASDVVDGDLTGAMRDVNGIALGKGSPDFFGKPGQSDQNPDHDQRSPRYPAHRTSLGWVVPSRRRGSSTNSERSPAKVPCGPDRPVVAALHRSGPLHPQPDQSTRPSSWLRATPASRRVRPDAGRAGPGRKFCARHPGSLNPLLSRNQSASVI